MYVHISFTYYWMALYVCDSETYLAFLIYVNLCWLIRGSLFGLLLASVSDFPFYTILFFSRLRNQAPSTVSSMRKVEKQSFHWCCPIWKIWWMFVTPLYKDANKSMLIPMLQNYWSNLQIYPDMKQMFVTTFHGKSVAGRGHITFFVCHYIGFKFLLWNI